MVDFKLKAHPPVVFAYSPNYIEVTIRVENPSSVCWSEADVSVPEHLSLSPDGSLRKGRVRIGIVGEKEYVEKAVRIYAGTYTNPQVYRCKITLYTYNKDGVIEKRMEKPIDIRCETKKEPVL